MRFRFNPFEGQLSEVLPSALKNLYAVSEGWYVEYKSQPIPVKAIAKSLSAFANQYGGWLIIGIEEDPQTHVAKSFPGVEESNVGALLQSIREASKDVLNPEVYFETREFKGPIDEINLESGRSVIVVRVPPGAETPYVHADGRVYRRVADSSAPKPETDRSTLDRLWDRAEKSRKRLEKFVTRCPAKSKTEESNSYLHLSIMSDPYEVRGDYFRGSFTQFSKIMKENPIPFDNIFPRSNGFVARQAVDNEPYHRVFTWEFDRHCHSFVTLPINVFSQPYSNGLLPYQYGTEYSDLLDEANIANSRILDLNLMLVGLAAIIARHRNLALQAGIPGPFYIKAHLENVWRTVPFLDMVSFINCVKAHGIPVVQDVDVLAPDGTGLETFVLLPENNKLPEDLREFCFDAILIAMPVFEALGVPREVYSDLEGLKELLSAGERYKYAQRFRNENK